MGKGYERGGPLPHVADVEDIRRASVPFIAMAEAWVLEGLRRAGVRPQRIRPALCRLQSEFGREYVLVSPALANDGIDVLWDFAMTEAGADLIEGGTGRPVIREIVRTISDTSAYRFSGQPVFAGTGTKVANVAAMLKAGEGPDVVAEEHGIGPDAVRSAARVLLGRAA